MAMRMLKMGKNRMTHISLIWVTILLTASSGSENIPKITSLDCFNDFYSKIFCFWKVVDSNSNCSEDFVLTYTDFREKKEKCHDLKNDQSERSEVSTKCVCNIPVSSFAVAENYKIEVKSHGEPVGSTTIHIGLSIKPRAPCNVQVDFQEDQSSVVKWDTGYKSMLIRENLDFHVQIICKHNRNVAMDYNPTNPVYHFNKKQLERGKDYVVRVRAKPVKSLDGTWSEWSSEVGWRNDYSLSILDLIDVIIPVTCIVVLCLITVSFVCLSRCKKKWWDNIPNPAKSTIVKTKLIQKHRLIPDRKFAEKKSCGSFFSRIVKAHKSKCDQLNQHDTARQYLNCILSSDSKKYIFEPKNEDIERCVEIHPKKENENNPVQKDKLEHKAEDHPMEEDMSIANMFFTILHDSSSKQVDTFGKLNTESIHCPALMDCSDKEEKQQSNSVVSGHQKLRYHSYDSDDSPLDSSSTMDKVKTPHFDQWTNSESLRELQFNPKGILYYNTKYFCSPIREDESREIVLKCLERKTGPTPICQVSGYQSFDQAVQENDPEFGYDMSGYKSFDHAVQQGDKTSILEVNEYKSFVQAVQENVPGLGCHISGYKSFNQTVQQSGYTSTHKINGYQSFDQAIEESKISESTNCSVLEFGYKPFDSVLCQTNDYLDKNLGENDHLMDTQCENTNYDNSQEYRFLSPGLELRSGDLVKTAKEKNPSFSNKAFNASKLVVDTNLNKDMALKHEGIPLALTFDICEHLKNLENIQGHKMSHKLETSIIGLNYAIFPCHLKKIPFTQEQLTINKNLTLHNCPSTRFSSFIMPFYVLDVLDFSQTANHLLIQQGSLDKDGNSYMQIK